MEVIPNGIDITRYKPVAKQLARNLLGLPQNKKLILFGAMSSTSDARKGFQHLQPALWQLADEEVENNHAEVVIFEA